MDIYLLLNYNASMATKQSTKKTSTKTKKAPSQAPSKVASKRVPAKKPATMTQKVDYYPNRMTVAISALAGSILVLVTLIAVLGIQ